MNRKKYIITILMVCMLAALLVGCKGKKEKKSEIVKGTIPEMIEAMLSVKEGKLQIEITDTVKFAYSDEDYTKHTGVDIVFDRENGEYSVSGKYRDNKDSGSDKKKDVNELVRITGNKLYFNLEALTGSSLLVGTNVSKLAKDGFSGWFAFPLPDDFPKDLPTEGIVDALLTLVEKAVKGLPTEGVDGDYTVTLKTRDDYAQLLNLLKDYVDKDMSKATEGITGLENALLEVDWNKYVDKLLATYESDIREVVKSLSQSVEIDESYIDEIVKEAKNQDFNKIVKEYLKKSETDTGSFQQRAAATLDYLIKDLDSAGDVTRDASVITVRIEADDDAYKLTLRLTGATESGEVSEIVFRLTPGSQSVSAPSDTKTVKQVADMISTEYLAYVERSRMSTDIDIMCECLAAAEKIACDPMFDLPENTVFSVYFADGEITFNILSATGSSEGYENALTEWKYLANYGGQKLGSSTMKKATARFLGTIDRDGSVTWKSEEVNDSFREMYEFSPDFKRKYGDAQ